MSESRQITIPPTQCIRYPITLGTGEFISRDHLPETQGKCSLLQAGTGVGKTTFIMDGGFKEYPFVIQVIPSVLKVTELEQQYAKQTNGISYLFYYDKKAPNEADLQDKARHIIVCTFDKLEAVIGILPKKQLSSALLVVDECHKLYSAGSYRDEAINSILMHIQHGTFPSMLALTATFSQSCWDTLDLPLDAIYQVRKDNALVKRSVEMILLKQGDQYSFISLVAERIRMMKQNGQRKKIIIRLNHREKCELLAAALEKYHGVKTLAIHSKSKNDLEVKTVFTQQSIPADVDVIFCTSIMDEAVNINNQRNEIDSVFVIGKDAHPEELVQFLGRLRKTTVPCFVVLHTGISEDHLTNMESLKKSYEAKNLDFIQKLNQLSELLSAIFEDFSLDMYNEGQLTTSLYKRMSLLNETFNELAGAKLFTLFKGEVCRNSASIAANYYRKDKANCYENFYYFRERIRELLPDCSVKYRVDTETKTPSYLKEFMDQEKQANAQAYAESIDTAFEIVLSNPPLPQQSTVDELSNLDSDRFEDDDVITPTRLRDFGIDILQQQEQDEQFIDRLVAQYEVRHHTVTVEMVHQIALLTTLIDNLPDIYQIIKNKQFSHVCTVAKGYSSNIVVQYLTKRFYRYHPEKYFHEKFRLTPEDAATLLLDAFESINKNSSIPMRSIMKQKLITGLKVDYRTKKVEIDPSKAANFIAKFFAVKDRNAKKADKRYLEFTGIVYGDYQYISLASIQKQFRDRLTEFVLGDRAFDAKTGELISGPASPLAKAKLPFDDEDVFDDEDE